jgi:hypothetical protein
VPRASHVIHVTVIDMVSAVAGQRLAGQEQKKGGVIAVSETSLRPQESRAAGEEAPEAEWLGAGAFPHGPGSEWEQELAALGEERGPGQFLTSAVQSLRDAALETKDRLEEVGNAVADGDMSAAVGALGRERDGMDLGLPATMLRIYREEGVVVLFNGVVPRVLQLGFSHAVRFTAYGASRGFVVGSMLSDTDISSVLPKIF